MPFWHGYLYFYPYFYPYQNDGSRWRDVDSIIQIIKILVY